MTTQPATTSLTDEQITNLKTGYNAFYCARCGHHIGAPLQREKFLDRCPPEEGCGFLTTFHVTQ